MDVDKKSLERLRACRRPAGGRLCAGKSGSRVRAAACPYHFDAVPDIAAHVHHREDIEIARFLCEYVADGMAVLARPAPAARPAAYDVGDAVLDHALIEMIVACDHKGDAAFDEEPVQFVPFGPVAVEAVKGQGREERLVHEDHLVPERLRKLTPQPCELVARYP